MSIKPPPVVFSSLTSSSQIIGFVSSIPFNAVNKKALRRGFSYDVSNWGRFSIVTSSVTVHTFRTSEDGDENGGQSLLTLFMTVESKTKSGGNHTFYRDNGTSMEGKCHSLLCILN